MTFKLRFLEDVDPRLKSEMVAFGRWIRRWYDFPVHLEMRLISTSRLTDFDGSECSLRFWQNGSEGPVTVEIAVGRFAKNLEVGGPDVAYPTIAAAIGRGLKYYFISCRDAPIREDFAKRWGDRLLDAYVDESTPPAPWTGAWKTSER
ncbi:MAG: hypothetical protein ACJAZ8_000923 [Planctomycetota bacterium]|jgi:hypothetical protein